MQRILVIGSPGAGKSTFSRALAERTGLPLIHLDRHHWGAGWTEPDPEAWEQQVRELVKRDRWIMDGNYGRTLELRLARADTVIELQCPAWRCLWRALRRAIEHRGRTRPDMAEGCPEHLNLPFLLYISSFPRRQRPVTEAKLTRFSGRIIRLRSPREAQRFLASAELRG